MASHSIYRRIEKNMSNVQASRTKLQRRPTKSINIGTTPCGRRGKQRRGQMDGRFPLEGKCTKDSDMGGRTTGHDTNKTVMHDASWMASAQAKTAGRDNRALVFNGVVRLDSFPNKAPSMRKLLMKSAEVNILEKSFSAAKGCPKMNARTISTQTP